MSEDSEPRPSSEKSYARCSSAANHIASIGEPHRKRISSPSSNSFFISAKLYGEHYCLRRAAGFLCYYVFSAAIMHIASRKYRVHCHATHSKKRTRSVATYSNDPQALEGLIKCVGALSEMELTWPSAARALVLVRGSKVYIEQIQKPRLLDKSRARDRPKRAAEADLDGDLDTRGHDGSMHAYSYGLYPVSPAPSHAATTAGSPWGSISAGVYTTAMLPQMYSTGLVDEYGSPSMALYVPGQHPQPTGLWDEFASGSFPALIDFGGGLPAPGNAHPHAMSAQGEYVSDQYGVYGEWVFPS